MPPCRRSAVKLYKLSPADQRRGPALTSAAVCALLAACAQAPAPVQPLPPGPTADEVADYARAQLQYRYGLASGNGDDVMHATNTFSLIAREVLSRQYPRLFDAQVLCERYLVAEPRVGVACD